MLRRLGKLQLRAHYGKLTVHLVNGKIRGVTTTETVRIENLQVGDRRSRDAV